MLKVVSHKVFSLLMAFLVLFSTVSFTVEKHFCGDNLIDTAVFTKVQGCGMEMSSSEKKQCCKDELEVVKGQDKLKLSKFEELPVHHQGFITSFAYSLLNLFESIDKEIVPHIDYSPPNLVADIQVLDQVYII
jgi:hypothetical protein